MKIVAHAIKLFAHSKLFDQSKITDNRVGFLKSIWEIIGKKSMGDQYKWI